MRSHPTVISYSDFLRRFRPITAGICEGEIDRSMFAAFGKDLALIRITNPSHVWTVLDVELAPGDRKLYDDEEGDNCWLIVPGYHYVNRLAYMITEVAWEDDTIEVVY